MTPFDKVLDGSGKRARSIQVDYFKHLTKQWPRVKAHGMSGPPGIGKSFIARTIQRTIPNTVIVTTNNLLVDQYTDTYKELVGVKGKDFYEDLAQYHQAREAALSSPSVFNPMSFYYFHLRYKDARMPGTVVIDEAHKLADMLMLIISQAFKCAYYGIPSGLTELQFLRWLNQTTERLEPVIKLRSPTARQSTLIGKAERLFLLRDYLKDNFHKVKISYEMLDDYKGRKQLNLLVKPLEFPAGLLKTIFGDAKLVLLSGTLTKFDMDELFPGQEYDYKQYEPLAPKEQRPVYCQPIPKAYRRNVQIQAQEVVKLYAKHGKPATLVHLSYADAQPFQALKKIDKNLPIITHEKDTKADKLDRFKREGGILLASGMAEGVDLPGDLCRLIIIPRLLFANKGDTAVLKRMALPNGQMWYQLNTMMTTLQQLGRGVRGPDDWCNAYILDYLFPNLMEACGDHLTNGFKESVK